MLESNTIDENVSKNEVKEEKKLVFPVPDRHLYRYNKKIIRGLEVLVKKSCRACHGTGYYGYLLLENKAKSRLMCSCIIQKEEEKEDAKKTI